SDPLGRTIEAAFALLADGSTAVVEVAAASGLGLVSEQERDALAASTRGTGELVLAALQAGARTVLVAAGGSASTDGGRGAIEVIRDGGGLRGARLEVLCDTDEPFERAATVFAPQKGADARSVAQLDRRLEGLAHELPRDPRGRPRTGAAGGLAGGLWAAFDAALSSGAERVLTAVDAPARLAASRWVISGEGCLDSQSLHGKLVGRLARLCAEIPRPLAVIAGRVELDEQELAGASISRASEARTLAAIEDVACRWGAECANEHPASSDGSRRPERPGAPAG
ncbi:MAG TPA: glycerate kinase, partial [Solirubrobacteraceae bacterium]|nr:glycerate kinase [Solirubrobacteraceae bacterium]